MFTQDNMSLSRIQLAAVGFKSQQSGNFVIFPNTKHGELALFIGLKQVRYTETIQEKTFSKKILKLFFGCKITIKPVFVGNTVVLVVKRL